MADKKKSTKKPDLLRPQGPRQEEKMIVNPKTGKKEKALIIYD